MNLAKQVRKLSPRTWFRFKLLRYKYYNGEREIWLVRHLPVEGKLAIDVGASIGLYARELARYAAQVIAFEANPRVAEFARHVLPSNVEVKSIALSRASGETTLRVPLNGRKNTVDELGTIEQSNVLPFDTLIIEKIETRKLDDYGYQNCGFIKIDVEGHEEAVLDGAMHLIERQKPILMIEIIERFNPGSFRRITERLSALDYKAYHFFRGHLQPVTSGSQGNLDLELNCLLVPDGIALPRLAYWERLASEIRSILGR